MNIINQNLTQQSQYRQNQNNVNFKGIEKVGRPIRRLLQSSEDYHNFMSFIPYAANVLGEEDKVLERTLMFQPGVRVRFFEGLTEKFNRFRFDDKDQTDHNPKIVREIFDMIKFPLKGHLKILETTGLDLKALKEIYGNCKDSKKLSQLAQIYTDLSSSFGKSNLTTPERKAKITSIILDIVSSENSDEIITNYSKYQKYINRHIDNNDVIKNLNKELTSRTFDVDIHHRTSKLDATFESINKTEHLNPEKLLPVYSEEGCDVIERIGSLIRINDSSLSKDYDRHLVNIFATTTKENSKARLDFINNIFYNSSVEENMCKNEIDLIDRLFTMMDKDPKVMKAVQAMNKNNVRTKNTEEYLNLLENVDPNILRRDAQILGDLVDRNYCNPYNAIMDFYTNEPTSLMGRFIKGVKRIFTRTQEDEFNAPRHKHPVKPMSFELPPIAESAEVKAADVNKALEINKAIEEAKVVEEAKVEGPAKAVETKPAEEGKTIQEINEKQVDVVKQNEITEAKTVEPTKVKKVAEPTIEQPTEIVEAATPKRRKLFGTIKVKEPNAKKLTVINDVNAIIERKLGSRVLEDQASTYARNATKIRLSLLPEIFESIKDTRAAARAKGTFNRRTTECNADAVDLYRLINGKNRRYVNYMLKVRNADGSRKYTVKDIINILSEKNKEVRKMKADKTAVNPFRAIDEKNMYAEMLNEQITQYGKLPVARNKKQK